MPENASLTVTQKNAELLSKMVTMEQRSKKCYCVLKMLRRFQCYDMRQRTVTGKGGHEQYGATGFKEPLHHWCVRPHTTRSCVAFKIQFVVLLHYLNRVDEIAVL